MLAEASTGTPQVILMGTGSEVQIAMAARQELEAAEIPTRVVSLPCVEWFAAQSREYREEVLPPSVRARVSVEAAVPMGWREFVGDAGRIVGLNHYGASAAYTVLYEEFGLTADAVVNAAHDSIAAAATDPVAPIRPGLRGRPAPPHRRPLTRSPDPTDQPERHLTWHRTRSSPSCPPRGYPSGWTTCPATASAAGTCSHWSTSTPSSASRPTRRSSPRRSAGRTPTTTRCTPWPSAQVSVEEALRTITAADVRDACDLLRPVADRQPGDGRVSLEVAPGLAHDTDATAAEAAHLWWLVDRPNLFIKIPATEAGLPAITTSIAKGISVNVTLIFSPERYRAVMDAYLSGLEQRIAENPDAELGQIASVASFFVSRVDTEIDKRLDKAGADPALKSKAGVANAQLAYQAYEEVFSSDRWQALEAKGARPQRPLWASTGVKNPELPDTLYVGELVAPGTVNTMPEKTMKAFADHGSLGTPVQKTYDDAAATMQAIRDAGVDLDDVFRVLEDEGVQKFIDSWDELTDSVRSELEDKA